MTKYWTDYPIAELGDDAGKISPIRECTPTHYDGNKYCRVIVGGVKTSFKAGYIYTSEGRCGDVNAISSRELNALPYDFPA